MVMTILSVPQDRQLLAAGDSNFDRVPSRMLNILLSACFAYKLSPFSLTSERKLLTVCFQPCARLKDEEIFHRRRRHVGGIRRAGHEAVQRREYLS